MDRIMSLGGGLRIALVTWLWILFPLLSWDVYYLRGPVSHWELDTQSRVRVTICSPLVFNKVFFFFLEVLKRETKGKPLSKLCQRFKKYSPRARNQSRRIQWGRRNLIAGRLCCSLVAPVHQKNLHLILNSGSSEFHLLREVDWVHDRLFAGEESNIFWKTKHFVCVVQLWLKSDLI